MGNECDQCQAVTQGCKRQQFRTQLKNRQKLDLSRAQGNDKSKSKLQPILALRNVPLIQTSKKQMLENNDMDNQESLEIIKHRKPPEYQKFNQNNSSQRIIIDNANKKNVINEKTQNHIKNHDKPINKNEISDNDSHSDLKYIKLPMQSGIQDPKMKRLQQLQKALMMSRQPTKKNRKSYQSQQIKDHNNSTVNIIGTIQEQSIQIRNKQNLQIQKISSKRNENTFNKIQSKGIDDMQKSFAKTKTFSYQKQRNSISKYDQTRNNAMEGDLQSHNPSKVLRQFNHSLNQSPIHPLKHQPKSPIDHQQSQIPYDESSITQPIQNVQQHVFYLKPGVYFQGFVSSINKKLQNQGTIKFQSDQTQMLVHFKNGSINPKKNLMMAFQDGSIFEGAIKKDSQKSQFMTCGEGKFIFPDQSYYVGEWLKNLPHGKGKHRFPDDSYYEGDFIEGRKQGQGRFATAEGDLIYQGSFLNNHIEGFGQMSIIQPNTGKKRIYKGYFKNGKLEGQNCQVQYVQESAKYIGAFHDGKKNGRGKYYYGDGRTWQGEWKENRQNGFGKFKNQKGVQIEGYWIDGIKSEGKPSKR